MLVIVGPLEPKIDVAVVSARKAFATAELAPETEKAPLRLLTVPYSVVSLVVVMVMFCA